MTKCLFCPFEFAVGCKGQCIDPQYDNIEELVVVFDNRESSLVTARRRLVNALKKGREQS